MVQPFEIENYIDKKLLDKKSLDTMGNIKEDDNPIIVKYYLK